MPLAHFCCCCCCHCYYYFFLPWYFMGLKISKCRTVCPEWLRWGLGNCERVGKADCIQTRECKNRERSQLEKHIIIASLLRTTCAQSDNGAIWCCAWSTLTQMSSNTVHYKQACNHASSLLLDNNAQSSLLSGSLICTVK